MMRLYEFDLDAGTIEVQTFSPYWLSIAPGARSQLGSEEVALNDAANHFTMKVNFRDRFKPLPPVKLRNSHDLAVRLQSTGEFWMVGATQYGRLVGPAGGCASLRFRSGRSKVRANLPSR